MAEKKSVRFQEFLRRSVLIALFPILVAGLTACGSKGDTGPRGAQGEQGVQGPEGPTGPTGPAGPVTTTSPSCQVCHGSGKIADIDSTNSDSVHFNAGQDETPLTISNIQLTNSGGAAGTLIVTFHVTDSSGNAYTDLVPDGTEVMIGDLVPANTIPIQGTAEKYQSRLFAYWVREGYQDPHHDADWGGFDDSDAANGNYAVTLAAGDLGTAAATDYVDLANHVQRVAIVTSNAANSAGDLPAIGVGVHDFTGVPLVDGADTSADATAQYQAAHVTIQACKKCHGEFMQRTAHGNYWADTRICVICHSPQYGSFIAPAKAIFEQWVHEIHNGQNLGGQDFSDVVFPQPVDNCVACHQDPDGLTAGSNADMNAWKTKPNATACTSCHNDVNPLDVDVQGIDDAGNPVTLPAGQNHAGGWPANACGGCHTATDANTIMDIVGVHKLPDFVDGNATTTAAAQTAAEAEANTPEFDVTMTVTEPDGTAPAGGFFAAGDTPLVTVTLKNHADGTAVDPSVYTTLSTDATSAAGVAGGGLSGATLYVYSRGLPTPVLTLNAAADRGVSLLLPSSDPNVTTDATGYHYLLQAIPANMTAGTYVASVQMNDYGAISDTDYVTTSVGKVLFQIGTADVTAKVSGDACADCHGDTRMHLTGAHPHNVPFDTDYCDACHDTTGKHGNPIANRVHAVHSANSAGDLGSHASYDWAAINFPQDVNNCKACHTSGNAGYLTGFEPVACYGCHGDAGSVGEATWDHMLQNGANVLDQNPNFK